MTQNITIEEDRNITRRNMSTDTSKLHDALMSINDLTPEGEIIREDLIGLLMFEIGRLHQIDSLMIERRKLDKFESEEKVVLQ